MSNEPTLKRILIFDDDADLRKLLLVYLGKMFDGVELEEYDPLALGAPDESFDWSRFDILILDYFLCIHGVTGLDILHANRKNPEFPATIMLTGAGNEEVAVRALKAGVYDYFRKQSLDKQELKASILKAYSSHHTEKERKKEKTQQGNAFNKSLFYQQLDFHKDIPGYRDRVLLLIELADNQAIIERDGVILRDNIIRYIAKQSFEIFNQGDFSPSITRLGDTSIALLINMPDTRKTLEFNLNGLLNHLNKRSYKFDDRKIKFGVNIGVVNVTGDGTTKDIILERARISARLAAGTDGISYKIFESGTEQQQQDVVDKSPEVPSTDNKDVPEIVDKKVESTPISAAPVDLSTKELQPAPTQEATPPAVAETTTSADDVIQFEDKPSQDLGKQRNSNAKSVATQTESPQKEPAAAENKQPPILGQVPKPVSATPSASSAPAKPRKSIEELKAELEKAKTENLKPVAETPPQKSEQQNSRTVVDINIDITSLDEDNKNLFKAFEEKRVILSYQPVISLLNEEVESEDEIHSVGLLLADEIEITEEELRSRITSKQFKMYIDRWVLRDIIGKLSIKQKITDSFIIKISDDSIADASFFNWFRTMLTGLDSKNLGKYISLEIDIDHLGTLEKQANALISYLRKTHDFSFVLGNIEDYKDIITYANKIQFDIIRCKSSIIKELKDIPVDTSEVAGNDENATHFQLDLLKSKNTRFIADDILDATTLTDAISLGTEYAMGEFIGEPVTQLDDTTNIESFEIV